MDYLVHQLLRKSAGTHPDRLALIDRDRTITYAELDRRSDEIARALAGLGVGIGTPVALAFRKSIDAICALYGVLKAGAAYVPIDPLSPPGRAAQIIANCRVAHLVTSAHCLNNLVAPMLDDREACATIEHIVLPEEPTQAQQNACRGFAMSAWTSGQRAVEATPTDMDLAYILHTSGSTGEAKGVALTHRNALAFAAMCGDFFAVTERDRLANHAPLHFDLSVFDLFVAARTGAAVVLLPSYLSAFARKMAAFIDEYRITIWNSVASALTLMNDRGALDAVSWDSLRVVIFSGEILPVRVLRQLCQKIPAAQFYNVYGQTEANSSTYYRVGATPSDDRAVVPIGKPFPNFDVFALDADGQVIESPGQQGELYVRAATVAAGYYGDAGRTGEKFVPDPRSPVTGGRVYRTGDIVSLDDEGNYVFVGRGDQLIKTRGYRVEMGEVERALLAARGVDRAVVVAIPDPAIGNRLCAFVTPRAGATLVREKVLAACRARLPSYMMPASLDIRDALPSTSTGKTDRSALRAQLLASDDRTELPGQT
ncbi:MAG: amino acid adenylation domain-containing protein [Proteobacteria bacterium]|nr:amino acid adenylation domain-containing protein [Pseudomonadota bacterium]